MRKDIEKELKTEYKKEWERDYKSKESEREEHLLKIERNNERFERELLESQRL